jgi:hydrogenase large subunit
MSQRVVVDPITRIEGHLRIEAATDAEGNISKAYSSGTSVRGIETILKGRDPRDAWAFAQRICGVCTLVHGMASVRSVENALGYPIPKNAQLIRNLMIAAQYIHDHVMHFYHLHALDWVDVVSALKADPKETSTIAQSISDYPKSSPGYFKDVQKRVQGFVESGQLGIFAKGYWGHPEYKLPPEVNLLAVAHYLEALAWQRDAVKLHAIFGGKNPHPNFLVGGAPSPISVEGSTQAGGSSATALNVVGLQQVRDVIENMQTFVEQVYLPDTKAIASYYKDWFKRGGGVENYLTFGDFPMNGMDDPSSFLIPSGAILGRDLSKIHPVDPNDPEQLKEFVSHSWYDYSTGNREGLHPYEGETNLNYAGRGGPKPPYSQLDVDDGYSWLKSPRWRGKPMEVGPLARVLMLYASGHEPTKELADQTLKELDLPLEAMFSTMGRTASRSLESKIVADMMMPWWQNLVDNIKSGDLAVHNEQYWEPSSWPKEARGVGILEAPRGALAHYMVIKDEKIDNYQAVVPSTWNAGPLDSEGQHGPYEASLMDNHALYDPKQPLEVLRTVHSFDPCLACAVHLTDPDGEEMMEVKVL